MKKFKVVIFTGQGKYTYQSSGTSMDDCLFMWNRKLTGLEARVIEIKELNVRLKGI